MDTRTPARESRETNRSKVSRSLHKSLAARNVDGTELARACGVKQQHVAKWCSVDEPHSIPLHDLLQAPPEVALDLLRMVAEHHGFAVGPAGEDEADPASVQTLHGVLVTTSALALVHTEALADGHIDPSEARRIEAEASSVIDAATRLANGARSVVREHEHAARTPRESSVQPVSRLQVRNRIAMGDASGSGG